MSLLIKLQGRPAACDFIKKDWHRSSPVNFAKFLQNSPQDDWLQFFYFTEKDTSFYKTSLVAAFLIIYFPSSNIKYRIARQSFHLCTSETDFLYTPSSESLAPEHFSLIRTFAKLIRLHLPHLYVFDFQAVTHCSG